jgi:hypothetical protein
LPSCGQEQRILNYDPGGKIGGMGEFQARQTSPAA